MPSKFLILNNNIRETNFWYKAPSYYSFGLDIQKGDMMNTYQLKLRKYGDYIIV